MIGRNVILRILQQLFTIPANRWYETVQMRTLGWVRYHGESIYDFG